LGKGKGGKEGGQLLTCAQNGASGGKLKRGVGDPVSLKVEETVSTWQQQGEQEKR